MKSLSKIGILLSKDSQLTFELEEIQSIFNRHDVEMKLFYESDSILEYKPDCVIVTSLQEPKLTPFPTYGLIKQPRDFLVTMPRFLRNALTYDGYFCTSPRLTETLRDMMFGARKLGSAIEWLDFFPARTEYKAPALDASQLRTVIFEPDLANTRFTSAISQLLKKFNHLSIVTLSVPKGFDSPNRVIIPKDAVDLSKILNASIVICLESGDEQEQTLQMGVFKAIASSAITITHGTKWLKEQFKDNLYYLPPDVSISELKEMIGLHIQTILKKPEVAARKAIAAQQIFSDSFAFDHLYPKFLQFHEKTLIQKGYMPHPDPEIEKKLPSVSYIMRTGGKHRPFLERALDCLAAQQYPNMNVIFVTHIHVPFLNDIIKKYSSIKFKVIESIKSRRSQAIRDGMAAVETDFFGLFDDDDELFPNHVRSLVKTMQYHSHRDWRGEISMVYSGSIHADDTYSVYERVEFHDHLLEHKNEKRAIEHFKFYSSVMMSQHMWFMPNGWLARTKLIDNELLDDPGLDTCEDLYFELQIAQRGHYAFSVEVTAVHHFHHLGNSTIDDSHKHVPDTQRISLRNFSRVFPPDALYDSMYDLIGRSCDHDPNQFAYQDQTTWTLQSKNYECNSFFPFRRNPAIKHHNLLVSGNKKSRRIPLVFMLPFKGMQVFSRFLNMDEFKRSYYINRYRMLLKQYGYRELLIRIYHFTENYDARNGMPRMRRVIWKKSKNSLIANFYSKLRKIVKFKKKREVNVIKEES